ncbi:YcgJ family protein [Ignatzschineria sp. LJL83]
MKLNTKLKLILSTTSLILITACATTQKDATNTINNPAKGVLCDQYICVDQQGVSIGLTEHYLGTERAEALLKAGKFDTSAMTFSNGVFCDTKAKLCYVDRYFNAEGQRSAVSPKYTAELFQ